MIDSRLAGTGNSRFLKSVSNFKTLYPTYDDFVAALIAGTLPIDLNGINPDGWTQQGTPLNKANLLSDDVANGLGLVDDATPNGAFNAIISAKGTSNGFATLDSSGKVPSAQLPSMDYIPTSQKGVASGVASLDSSGKVPSSQLNLSSSVTSASTTTAANSAAVKTAYGKADSAYTLASGKVSMTSGSPTLSAYSGYSTPTLLNGGYRKFGDFVLVDIIISVSPKQPGNIYKFNITGLPTALFNSVEVPVFALQSETDFAFGQYNASGVVTIALYGLTEFSANRFRVQFSYLAS